VGLYWVKLIRLTVQFRVSGRLIVKTVLKQSQRLNSLSDPAIWSIQLVVNGQNQHDLRYWGIFGIPPAKPEVIGFGLAI
jgi:hypothetical protein